MPDELSNQVDLHLIWLEVANVRLNATSLQIQVKGDRTEREPIWWSVDDEAYDEPKDPQKLYRTLCDGLDKKRIVIAGLASNGPEIKCKSFRIQYADSAAR